MKPISLGSGSARQASFQYVKYVLATSLGIFFVATVALVGAAAANARRDLIAHSESNARLLVKNLNYRIHNEFILPIRAEGQHINPEGDWAQFQWLDDVIRHAIYGHGIYKLKMWNPAGVIVYSTDPTVIGETEADNANLAEALRGRSTAKLEEEPEVGAGAQATTPFHDVVEVYVPVWRLERDPERPTELEETDQLYAVFEIYFGVENLLAQIRRSQLLILLVSVGIMAGVYGVLYLVVRGGERRLTDEISQRMELEKRLREAEEIANLGMLTAGIAHEVRTPLGIVRSVAETLAATEAPPERRRAMLRACIEEVDRLGALLNRFLEFANPKAPELVLCDINQEVRAAVDGVRQAIGEAKVDFRVELGEGIPRIPCEPRLFQQVLTNLLINAVQAYDGAPGEVVVRTDVGDDDDGTRRFRLAVHDRGCGIPPTEIDRVFRPFHTTKAKGTGLGLAIAKKIVEMLGGTIAVESSPRDGTTFTIACPLEARGAEAGAA